MKKLLLTSAGFQNPNVGWEFLKLVGKEASEIRILFVPTASRTAEERVWVEKSRKELISIGVRKSNITDFEIDHKISYDELKAYDAVYVCGGNTFYLLKKTRETGFDRVIEQFVKSGKVYVGVSAGSILAGPNIEASGIGGADKNDVGIKDLTALRLTDIIVSPHVDSKEKALVEEFKRKSKYKVIGLTDEQALLVVGNKVRVIE